MDAECRTELLRAAREAIETWVRAGALPPDAAARPELCEPAGAFVSLHLRDDERTLRGCIGTLEADRPLLRAVRQVAVAAATRDPRFPPVVPAELGDVEIEISVLSAPHAVSGPEDVVVGRDGLIVSRGYRRGVLLPQVATEAEWDAETFLAHTCRKAGLPPDAWRDPDTRIEAFTAEVFHEP